MTWKGGMAFHGGVIGVILAMLWFCKRNNLSFLRFSDVITTLMPIGLFLGRLANFINGELYGKVTTVPWAVLFPLGGFLPRHPSQLYEAALEGIVLFILLFWSWRLPTIQKKPGAIAGLFLLGYGLARIFVEFFRVSEGIEVLGITLGQVLSLPMVIAGVFFLLRPVRTDLNAR
jgi:phosphatidylglycerol:prolipoprotein diacylglycerol transferase